MNMQIPVASEPGRTKQVDAELALPVGRVQLVQNRWDAPIDRIGAADHHHLELSLLPRSGEPQGCFPELWGAHRFEPIGDLFLLPAAQTFHARSRCRRQRSLICDLEPGAVQQWLDAELRWTAPRLRGGLDIGSARVRGLLLNIADELRRPGLAGTTMVELLVAQTAIELSRHLLGIEPAAARGGLAGWQLRRIDERLADGGGLPSLAELAALCGLSVRQLTRAFRASRGCSVGAYCEAQRLEQARRLLELGKSVKVVAYTLGFRTPSNFAAAFRHACGETPREYRQRMSGATRWH